MKAIIAIIFILLLGILLDKTNAQLVVNGTSTTTQTNVGIGPTTDNPAITNSFNATNSGTVLQVITPSNYTAPGAAWETVGIIQFTNILGSDLHTQNRLFFAPYMDNGDFSNLSQAGDAGIFYSNTTDGNYKAGLVIAPHSPEVGTPFAGIRMDPVGNIGIGQPHPQALLDILTTSRNATQTISAIPDNSQINLILSQNSLLNGFESWAISTQNTGNLNFNYYSGTYPNGSYNNVFSITPTGDLVSKGIDLTAQSNLWNLNGNNIYYNSGNVGIGTSTPQQQLDLYNSTGSSTIRLENNIINIPPALGIGSTMIQAFDISLPVQDMSQPLTGLQFNIGGSYEGNPFVMSTDMNLSGSGLSILLGNTMAQSNLHVLSNFRISPAGSEPSKYQQAFIIETTNGGTAFQLLQNTSGQNTPFEIGWPDATIPAFYIESNGNIGFNTSSPNATLDVAGTTLLEGNVSTLATAGIGVNTNPTYGWLQINHDGDNTKNEWYQHPISIWGTTQTFYIGVSSNHHVSYLQSVDESSPAVSNIALNPRGGNVGIGTSTPGAPLDVTGLIHISGDQINTLSAGQGTYLGAWNNLTGGTGETDFINQQGGGTTGGFAFYNSSDNSKGHLIMYVNNSGQLYATEVTIQSPLPWSDYVFDNNYNLKSLPEVENYVKENKHLPDVPSAKEVEKDGIALGKMNNVLLKKVEELTLYVIEQDKKIEELKKEKAEEQKINVNELRELKKEVDELKRSK